MDELAGLDFQPEQVCAWPTCDGTPIGRVTCPACEWSWTACCARHRAIMMMSPFLVTCQGCKASLRSDMMRFEAVVHG